MDEGLWSRLNRRLGLRRAEALYARVRERGATRPGVDAAAVALFALSAVTILAALALPAAALWLLLARGDRLLAWIGAILLLGIAWLLRPRWHRIEAEEVVDPSTHPALVRLIGDVAREVGAPPPAIVAVDAAYNASVARAGWRQRRALTLGLPLAAALGPQDLVALLAHELGHLVNGDVTRSALVGAALTAAEGWVDVLTPRSWDEAGHRPGHRLGILLLWLLSLPAHAVLWTMSRLAWRRSQQAEYFADRVGASTSGTEGFLRLLSAFSDPGVLERAQHAVVVAGSPRGVTAEVPRHLRPRPAGELATDASWQTEALAEIDGTHPPLPLRVRMLLERPAEPPRLHLPPEEFRRVHRELEAHTARVDRRLADDYRLRIGG